MRIGIFHVEEIKDAAVQLHPCGPYTTEDKRNSCTENHGTLIFHSTCLPVGVVQRRVFRLWTLQGDVAVAGRQSSAQNSRPTVPSIESVIVVFTPAHEQRRQ